MFRRLWERVRRLWWTEPCAVCGKPAVGFASRLTGRIPTKDAAGKPVTKMYLSGAEWRCRACLESAR